MHILVTNDDGPPSNQSSPYVHTLVHQLQAAGHTVSVVLPHIQRSWIGKAHLVGHSITPTYFRPGPLRRGSTGKLNNEGIVSRRPLRASDGLKKGKIYENGSTAAEEDVLVEDEQPEQDEWVLVDSTPASCVQIGLHHFFGSRGPIDLVVSGPNYGRNTTAVFSLSSGTIGGAMEAAVCGKRSIALSYAFFDRNHDPDIVESASRTSVRVIEHLAKNWDETVHLYSVNVPLVEHVEKTKVLWTRMLQNSWSSGGSFEEVDAPDDDIEEKADNAEVEIREGEESIQSSTAEASPGSSRPKPFRYTHKNFKWAPKFKDVYDSVAKSEPGNDGWAVQEGFVSVTPLRANFMHVDGFEGEIKLSV